jgi:hypothetical protein
MQPLAQAILWNNQGARLLHLGELQNAFVWIHCAALIVDGVRVTPPHMDCGSCGAKERYKLHENDHLHLDQAESAPLHIEPMDSSCAQEHARYFLQDQQRSDIVVSVYQQPILLSTCMTMASLDGDVSVEKFVRGAIFFNLALNSHLSGLVVSNDTETVLEDALEMYECSLGLMDMDASGAICKCLILNNMAHVHYELCEYSESADCLKCLQEVLDQTNGLDEK